MTTGKKKSTIEGHCTMHPYAKLICPVCAGRKGGRGRKGHRGMHSELLALLKDAKSNLLTDEANR